MTTADVWQEVPGGSLGPMQLSLLRWMIGFSILGTVDAVLWWCSPGTSWQITAIGAGLVDVALLMPVVVIAVGSTTRMRRSNAPVSHAI